MGDAGGQPAAAGVHRDISLAEPWFVLALGDLSYADLQEPGGRRSPLRRRHGLVAARGLHAGLGQPRVGRSAARRSAQLQGALRAAARRRLARRAGHRLLRRGLVLVRLRRRSASSSTPSPTRTTPGSTGPRGPSRSSPRREASPLIKFVDHRRAPPGLLVGAPRQRSAAARDPRRVRQAVPKIRAQPERAQPRLRANEAPGARRAHHRRHGRRRARARGDALPVGRLQAARRSPPSAPSTTASSRSRCARRSCGSRRSAARPRQATKTSPAPTARSSTRSSSPPAAPSSRAAPRHQARPALSLIDERRGPGRRSPVVPRCYASRDRMPEAAPIPFFTLPNLLSLARLPLGWLFWVALGPTPARAAAALGVMGAAAATDVLDGTLARRRGTDAGGRRFLARSDLRQAVRGRGAGGAALRARRPARDAGAHRRARAPAAADVDRLPGDPHAATLAALRLPRQRARQGGDHRAVPGDRRAGGRPPRAPPHLPGVRAGDRGARRLRAGAPSRSAARAARRPHERAERDSQARVDFCPRRGAPAITCCSARWRCSSWARSAGSPPRT